jgi:hypothetical protein
MEKALTSCRSAMCLVLCPFCPHKALAESTSLRPSDLLAMKLQ